MTTTPITTEADSSSLSSLSARGVLDAASAAVTTRRLAEVAELELAARWAGMHGEAEDPRDPMIAVGGDGTPQVREYSLPELAIARSTHHATTRALVADVLDLQHRLPKTWAVVKAGECEPWVARKTAVASRALSLEAVGVVDDAVSAAIGGYPPSAVLELAAAKVIAADPEAYAARREAERHRRYVTLSKCDEQGYRTVIARVTAGDAAWVDALVQRVAVILAQTHGADHNHDELRSMAFGWLARPADLLKLLLDHTHIPDTDPTEGDETENPEDNTDDLGDADTGDLGPGEAPVEGEGNGQPGGGPYRYRRPRTGWDVDSDDPADDPVEGHDDHLDAEGYWPGEYGGDAGPAGPGPDTHQPPLADQDDLYGAEVAARIAEEFTHPTTGEETSASIVSAHLMKAKAKTTTTAKTEKGKRSNAKAATEAAAGGADDVDPDLAAWDSPPTGPPPDPPDDDSGYRRPADTGDPPVDFDDPTASEDPTLEGVPEDPDEVAARAPSRPVWLPSELGRTIRGLTGMSTRQLAALRGKGTLFVHLTDTSIRRAATETAAGPTPPAPSDGGLDTPARSSRGYSTTPGADLARTEGDVAPIRVADLADLLGHADVRVVPVRDLNTPRRADAYEHDETTKDHIWLTAGGDVWPYASRGTRDGVDFDHTVPYDPDGPPGQTGTHNAAPLRRRHHRWKTHGGYTYEPTEAGGHTWTTPHGLHVRVDHTGTHRITDDQR